MLLYADEDFPMPAVTELRRLGYDVLTAQEDGRNATPDPDVLARAHSLGRAVLTYNRRHYDRLRRAAGVSASTGRLAPDALGGTTKRPHLRRGAWSDSHRRRIPLREALLMPIRISRRYRARGVQLGHLRRRKVPADRTKILS